MMALLMMGGIGMGTAMGYYGMSKLYEKLDGLHEEMKSISMRASEMSPTASPQLRQGWMRQVASSETR